MSDIPSGNVPTEREIFGVLIDNLKGAADDCVQLASLPSQGPTYARFLERLKLITGAFRAIAWYRDDAGGTGAPLGEQGTHGFEALHAGKSDSSGWLEMAHMIGTLHEKVGTWLRGHYPRPLFMKAANVLREMQRQCERRRDQPLGKATMTRGAVLPPMRPGPLRQGRPVQVTKKPSGLIIPEGVSVH